MEWKRIDGTDCSVCESSRLLLNDYGVCAACWSDLTDDELANLTGAPVVYRLPPKPRRVESVIAMAVGVVVGNVIGWAVVFWLKTHL